MKKGKLPEIQIVPGLLTGINYKELISRDANGQSEKVTAPKKDTPKQKVFTRPRRH